jgi:hypothetical protein
MTTKVNDFHAMTTGSTGSTNVTGGSTGTTASSGDYLNAINYSATPPVPTVVTSNVNHGKGIQIAGGSGTTMKMYWNFSGGVFAVAFEIAFDVVPSIAMEHAWLMDNQATPVAFAKLNSNFATSLPHFYLIDASGGIVKTWNFTIAANQTYRIELYGAIGTTSTNGTMNAKIRLDDLTAQISGETDYADTTANTGILPFGRFQVGKQLSAVASTITWSALRAKDDSSVPFGPVGTNSAPVASAGADVTTTATSLTVSGTVTDSDGTIVSGSPPVWSVVSAGTTTSPLPTFGTTTNTGIGTGNVTPSALLSGLVAGTTVQVQLTTGTDNLGATGTPDTKNIFVAGTTVGERFTQSNGGGWAVGGTGATTFRGATNKASNDDTNWITSIDSPTGQSCDLKMEVNVPGDLTYIFRLRNPQAGTASATFQAIVFQGSTQITTLTTNPDSSTRIWTLTGSFADYTFTLSTAENAAITDRTDLRVRLIPQS